jgi:hypothetical protein
MPSAFFLLLLMIMILILILISLGRRRCQNSMSTIMIMSRNS